MGAIVASLLLPCWIFLGLSGVTPARDARAAEESAPQYRSPTGVAFRPDGKQLAVTDATAALVYIVDVEEGKVVREISLRGKPSGIVWLPDGSRLFVAEDHVGTVAEVQPEEGKVVRRFEVGPYPCGLALAAKSKILLVANAETHCVDLLSTDDGKRLARVPVVRRPLYIAVSSDESLAIVGNALPAGAATNPTIAATVSLIDLKAREKIADVALPPGSSNIRHVVFSPDGRWAYAAHTVGRIHVPTTQLDRGWVNTNGLSIIDVAAKEAAATVLLDHPMEGAADPFALAISSDGAQLYVTFAGTHQVARVDLARLHQFMDGGLPDNHRLAQTVSYSPGTESIWLRIKRDKKERSELVNDLAALYAADLIERFKLDGKGPRGAALSPDGKSLAVGLYFSGSVVLLDPTTGKTQRTISLGKSSEPDAAREGEIIFHDATFCFQHWMSCSTCHEDARVDGMNWDLLNDGIGNPKNARSLLWSPKTPPMMSLGVRGDIIEAIRAGFVHIQFHEPEQKTVDAVHAYLQSLEPHPSPFLVGGKPSDSAQRGKLLFEDSEVGCTGCHPSGLHTDLKPYDVGTKGEFDRNSTFDTPTLVELYRTAPYLHDGAAATMKDVLVDKNKGDLHGKTSHLTPQQIDDLVAFLLSL